MPNSTPSRRRQALFAVVAALLLLVVQELLFRAVFPLPELDGFTRLAYSPRRGSGEPIEDLGHRTLWWWSEPDAPPMSYRTNLYGFRDREWVLAPSPSRPRLVFVGDSLTEGLGTTDGRTLPDHFRRQADDAGRRLEVMNFGAAGFGLGEYLVLLPDVMAWFAPRHVVLVVYMNDLYQVPVDLEGPPGPQVRRRPRFRPRLLELWARQRGGLKVHRRWFDPPGEPRPLDVAVRFQRDPDLEKNVEVYVAPDLAASMRAGRLSPAVTNLLWRSEKLLPRSVDVRFPLRVARDVVTGRGGRLYVVYLPSLNQVSDAYLPAQLRVSQPLEGTSLQGEVFQQQARDLSAACGELGLPFFDATPDLRRAEAAGERLYWPYDGHMQELGYQRLAEAVWTWWQAESAAADSRPADQRM